MLHFKHTFWFKISEWNRIILFQKTDKAILTYQSPVVTKRSWDPHESKALIDAVQPHLKDCLVNNFTPRIGNIIPILAGANLLDLLNMLK